MSDNGFSDFLNDRIKIYTDFLKSLNINRHKVFIAEAEKYAKELKKAINNGTVNNLPPFKDPEEEDSSKENTCSNYNSNINVKKEKLSNSSSSKDIAEMPAPTLIPPKKRRVKKEKVSTNINDKKPLLESTRMTRSHDRNSDVVLQQPKIPIVDLIESDEEKPEPIRSTRSRVKKILEATDTTSRITRTKSKKIEETTETKLKNKSKRERSDTKEERIISKKSRSQSDENTSTRTEYEDAVSEIPKEINSTYILPKKEEKLEELPVNKTVVIEKPIIKQNLQDLLTDDESFKETNKKEVFSPYHKSPVKKKVEAFEKITEQQQPKSRTNTSKILKEIGENKGNVREKAKGFTPETSKKIPQISKSTSKINKYIGYNTLTSNRNSSKCCTPINNSKQLLSNLHKSTTTDFKEKELKKQDREKELKKQEIFKRAMSLEKKRKQEEKLLKIQQQKIAQEKEREKALEAQKLKEEKYKLMMQMKEEKQKQLREENEKKRLLAKQRVEEKKKEEEALRLVKENEMKKEKLEKDKSNYPIYMLNPAPLLPCDDCYDSDEEDGQPKRIPSWARGEYKKMCDYSQEVLGHKLKNTLFQCQNQTVDLREIFIRIDVRKLKRNSSAIWTKPPRFTLLNSFIQDD